VGALAVWAASSQQCSPDREPRGIVGGIASHLARCGKRSSRPARGSSRSLLRYSPRVLRVAGAASPREVDCRIIGSPGLVWLGRFIGPVPVPVRYGCVLYFAAWFMPWSLLGLLFAVGDNEGPPAHGREPRPGEARGLHDKRSAFRACRCRSRRVLGAGQPGRLAGRRMP